MKKSLGVVGCVLAGMLAVMGTSCSNKDGAGAKKSGGKTVTIKYELWDSNQLPAYQAAADEFTRRNPNIKIEIAQLGWDDYWTGLQTEMIGGSASDVFTDHLAKYLDFANKNQLAFRFGDYSTSMKMVETLLMSRESARIKNKALDLKEAIRAARAKAGE